MRILLASPRGFCAGVNMAIEALDRALELFGAPLYVFHEIVHNRHVVERFRGQGVVFVNDVDEVPSGSRLMYSAHGISPEGPILDELSPDGAILKASHRVWPHTEAIKAAATRYESGDDEACGFADRMATALIHQFLDQPFAGGWVDHRGGNGTALVDYVPASTLYHLVLAASVAAKGFAAAPTLAKAGA